MAFWDQTPASFRAIMAGVEARVQGEAERDLRLAYWSALFGRTKRLKPLAEYARDLKPRTQQKSHDMLAMLRSIAGDKATIRKVH